MDNLMFFYNHIMLEIVENYKYLLKELDCMKVEKEEVIVGVAGFVLVKGYKNNK